jgi:hypothetical protein
VPAAFTWTIDTVAPDTTIDKGPSDPSNDHAPSIEFSAGESATFECLVGEGEWVACSSGQSYADLADGVHTFQVRAADRAGNGEPVPAAFTWTIDTVAPRRTITAGPPELSISAAAIFEFAADDAAAFECRLDGGDWAACSSPQEYAELADGEHAFAARATDLAGNVGAEAGYVWTVDTVAPTTTVDDGPADPTNSTSASFEFSADEPAVFECRLDEGDWTACASPQGYDGLADGEHTFRVRATDGAGHQGAARRIRGRSTRWRRRRRSTAARPR